MNKLLTLLSIPLIISSCGHSVVYEGDTAANKKNIIKFSKHIETYIEQHVVDHFLSHVEPTYKTDQLGIALKNDTTQFINEFFCGKDLNAKFTCVDFDKIKSIDLIEIMPMKNDSYVLRYLIINDKDEELISEVYLFTDQKVYQLYSAVG
ncbi:MAG: hypothetical protein AB8B72_02065 [Crocinitomicaceae bacterium]